MSIPPQEEASERVDDDGDPCEGGAHCCCCGPGEPCCDCGQIMPARTWEPDWHNGAVCIDNAIIAYDDSLEDEDGPVDTVISSGDLGVLIGLAKHALNGRGASSPAPADPADFDAQVERVATCRVCGTAMGKQRPNMPCSLECRNAEAAIIDEIASIIDPDFRRVDWEGSEAEQDNARMKVCQQRRAAWGDNECDQDGSCAECSHEMAEALETEASFWRRKNTLDKARKIAALTVLRPSPVPSELFEPILKFIDNYFAPWGSWKTAWWEGEVSDNAAFSADNALKHVANLLRSLIQEQSK